jgi:hypothetical protein
MGTWLSLGLNLSLAIDLSFPTFSYLEKGNSNIYIIELLKDCMC